MRMLAVAEMEEHVEGVETGDWRLETGDWRLETGD
jgi:exonuclease VII small subunit